MRLYCVTYTQRDDEIGEHDTVEYFRTKRDAMRAVRGLNDPEPDNYGNCIEGSFCDISLECVELHLRKQEIIEALNLSNRGQSARNATLLEHFDDIGMDDEVEEVPPDDRRAWVDEALTRRQYPILKGVSDD